jgi:pimeloyl-ACP methyl ester carboxylesterase
MAKLTYAPDEAGKWRPVWDTRIAKLLNGSTPDLWPLFGALAHLPLLLLHGGRSNILRAETVEKMRAMRPDMDVTVLPDVGHTPTLSEPAATAALRAFIERVG